MNNTTDWAPAIAILAAGLVLGLLFIYTVRRRKSAASSQESERFELEAKRDLLLQQLGEVPEPEQRAALEHEAAEVLRDLDNLPVAAPAAVRVTFFSRHPVLKGYALGVASVVIVGLLGYYGSTFAEPREAASMGTSIASSAATPSQPPSDPELQKLEQAVAGDPENIEHRVLLAQAYFNRDNMVGVFEQTNQVLAKDPNDPRALTYNAIVLMAMGRLGEAGTNLERATKRDPKLLDAWVALASVRTQAGESDAAAAAIDAAIQHHPQDEKRLRAVLVEMRAQTKKQLEAPTAVAELPPDHPPMPAPAASAQQPAEAGVNPAIRITLSIDDSATLKKGVVYLIARPEGPAKGHPLAVKRVSADSFPLSVDLGGSDSMMGQPLPARVRFEARLDSDGDAGTIAASDPKATAESVAAGSVLALTLK
jgi:cytochrome c-type biogenesis protein CcmH/NrfG